MPDHLILTLEAPMIAFGGETIDNRGVVRDFPARSMLCGLLANALGWDRSEGARLDALQARLAFASARVRTGARRQEYQTARLFERDAGWTTRRRPEGRAPSPSFAWDDRWATERGERAKSLTHQRLRDFDADACVLVALALEPADEAPTLAEVAAALRRPERPLFVGRKPFIPSSPICGETTTLALAPIEALALALKGVAGAVPVQWSPSPSDVRGEMRPLGQGTLRVEGRQRIADERRHRTGVHGGTREVAWGSLVPSAASA